MDMEQVYRALTVLRAPLQGVARLLPQLARYCACEEVAGLILVSEGSVRLPPTLAGKPLRNLCLNQLWGIAL